MRSGGTPAGTLTTHSSPAARLPQEVVGTIIAYLIYDIPSLRACALTCHSWHAAAVARLPPRLYITYGYGNKKFEWPSPIQSMHAHRLLQFVNRVQIYSYDKPFSPKWFSSHILRQYSTLTNVRDLHLTKLDIPSFVPNIRRYFGHFLPTVESLTLQEPKGSNLQIILFIGLFQRVENLSLMDRSLDSREGETVEDLSLVPLSSPPLRGRLLVWHWKSVGFFKDMVRLFGGIQFYMLNLFGVEETRVLLDACAMTLGRLRLYPHDPHGRQSGSKCARSQANSPSPAVFSLGDFNLQQNRALQIIEITAGSVDKALGSGSMDAASRLLKYALATADSLGFCRVDVYFHESDFRGIKWASNHFYVQGISQAERENEASSHHNRFELLRELNKTRPLYVVLCAVIWESVREYSVAMLKGVIAAEKVRWGSHGLPFEPCVVHVPTTRS